MVLMRNYPSDNRLSTVKKKLRPQLKLYFNTSTVKFKKFTKYEFPRNPSYLFCNKNGRIVYTGGDWGEVTPKGFVKKIIRYSGMCLFYCIALFFTLSPIGHSTSFIRLYML